MTQLRSPVALLRPLSADLANLNSQAGEAGSFVLAGRSLVIGRDPTCDIAINPLAHVSVSRRHAELRPTEDGKSWEVCDLDSANGTFVNNQSLIGCRVLIHGDRLRLGHRGPEFQFEYASSPSRITPLDRVTPIAQITKLTLTQLVPILSTGRDLVRGNYFWLGMTTVGFVVAMFAVLGRPALLMWFYRLI